MRPLRLGAVDYLNARPLVHGLGADVSLRFDPPAVCAELLARGDVELGLIPAIAYFDRPGDVVVPGVSIGSDGPVASVALFTRHPVREIRSIALDTSSRSSVALTRILCARRFEIVPTFTPHAPDLPAMLAAADAALLIGDPALFADHVALGAEKVDLGAAWTELTGLPFVWAFWAGHPGAATTEVVVLLQAARDAGVAASDAIADAYCAGHPPRQTAARRYLRENINFGLDPRMQEGLATYYREAERLGLIAQADPVQFANSSS